MVLLSVLSAIGGLGVGAITGALVAHRLRERAEGEKRKWEKEGIVRLLFPEMMGNRSAIAVSSDEDGLLHINVTDDAWKTTRLRLAALLAEKEEFIEDFAKIVFYYDSLRRFMDQVREYRHLTEELERLKAIDKEVLAKAGEGKNINEAVEERIRDQEAAESAEEEARSEAADPEALFEMIEKMEKERNAKKPRKKYVTRKKQVSEKYAMRLNYHLARQEYITIA